jgi:hypothetical protein
VKIDFARRNAEMAGKSHGDLEIDKLSVALASPPPWTWPAMIQTESLKVAPMAGIYCSSIEVDV